MNSPYHLLTISTVVFLSYAVTWLLTYLSILPKVFHRRFWNTILLFVFLLSAVIGIILTLQVNFKFELPALDTYMVWHVDAGIALTLVSIFHIYWHWKYYINILKTNNGTQIEKEPLNSQIQIQYKPNEIKLFTFFLGFNTLVIQTIMLREFMVMFRGNEMVIGIILFFWMFFTGLGALFPNRNSNLILRWEILLPVLILLSAALIITSNYLRYIIFLPGEEIGLFQVIWFSAIFLFPVCFCSGYMFSKLVRNYKSLSDKNRANRIYSIETFGSALGGLLFTFILGKFFRSIEILSILFMLNSLALLYIKSLKSTLKSTLIITSIIILLASLLLNFDKTIKSPLFLNQKLISYHPSPFGDIAKTQQYEQENYYLNTDLLFNNQNTIVSEECVHFPALQSESPQNILVLGGNFPAIINELNKYNVYQIDFVEPNPVLFKRWNNIDSLNTNGIKIYLRYKDFRKYVEKVHTTYDVIILNLPSPDNLQSNRFYTDEFYKSLEGIITKSGVLGFNLPAAHNYLSEEQIKLYSSVFYTITRYFKQAEFLVSEGTYLVASNSKINMNVGELAEKKGLANEYVNSYYIDSWSMTQRNEDIKQNLVPDTKLNYDFQPIVFKNAIKNWLDKGQSETAYLIVFIVLSLFLFSVFFLNKAPQSSLFIAGFSTSAIELMLIYIFQIMFGDIYQYIGLLLALFMLGITIGASDKFSKFLKLENTKLRIVQLILAVIPLLIWGTLKIALPSILFFIIILSFGLIIPILTGWLFNYASQANKKSAGYNYFIDLAGSSIGVFLVSIFILPQVGLFVTLLILGGINLLGFLKK